MTKIRHARKDAIAVARELVRVLAPCCEKLIIAGSLRRLKPEVGDIELLYIPRTENRPVPGTLFDRKDYDLATLAILELEAAGVLRRRESTTGTTAFGEKNKLMLHVASGIPVDFFTATRTNWHNYLVCRTGSAENNTRIATAAKIRGLRWNPYGPGFTHLETGNVLPATSEEAVYQKKFEYRTYGPRWNEKTCAIGRQVTLSLGYGKSRRLSGIVESFSTNKTPQLLPGWSACFGDSHFTAAVVGIRLADPIRILAGKIAMELFTNAFGGEGTRLEIKEGDGYGKETSLGGWCFQAAVDQIEKVLIASND